jgi:diketogulonate reductase-like aldo/keto reductase
MPNPPPGETIGAPAGDPFFWRPATAFGKPVCRLGLASRGGSGLTPDDVHHALGRGVNVLNWPGTEDVLSRTIAELGPRRDQVVVCAQFEARTAADAAHELRTMLSSLGTDYLDVLTFYYVEEPGEWQQ